MNQTQIDTLLTDLAEVKRLARADEQLLLFSLAKVVQCLVEEHQTYQVDVKLQPADILLHATLDGRAISVGHYMGLQTPEPGAAAPVPVPTAQPIAPPARQGITQNAPALNDDHHMVLVLRVQFEKPVHIYNSVLRGQIVDRIADRANRMDNVAFVEIL